MPTFVGTNNRNTIFGGIEDDTIYGEGGSDNLFGVSGNDSLFGGDGGDSIIGNVGDDVLDGGLGNDFIFGDDYSVYFGIASLDFSSYSTALGSISYDGSLDIAISGAAGNDWLKGVEGIIGSSYADTLLGGVASEHLYGGKQRDIIQGFVGDDVLRGDGGADRLLGSIGNDLIEGGLGQDTLTGGDDIDTFRYVDPADSTRSRADIITDFERRVDVIDLSAIDADPTQDGDQAFVLAAGRAFTLTPGELIIRAFNNGGRILADIDGDGAADLVIRFEGAFTAPLAGDLVL